jgi:FAD/FMN-containing dehydrogenase
MAPIATQRLLDRLEVLVGPAGLWVGGRIEEGAARRILVRPVDIDETAAVVRLCSETRTPLVIEGTSGDATPEGQGAQVVLRTTRMDRVRAVDVEHDTLTVDGGVSMARAVDRAQAAGRVLRLPPGGPVTGTVGGFVARPWAAAGGLQVLGLEVVLPDGRVWHGLGEDATGCDLRGLFVGSGGTMGVITGVVLKLHRQAAPQPGCRPQRQGTSLRKSEVEIDLLQRIKRALDPHHIMNPGRLPG